MVVISAQEKVLLQNQKAGKKRNEAKSEMLELPQDAFL